MAKKIVETPLMKQYIEMKAKHPDAILLFRVGDFYETFSDDAIVASEILGITLTRRANGQAQHVELAGFPHHALDSYLPKLVRAGKRVAICEQLEDPKLTKKLVRRGITELVTPGVVTSDNILNHNENNFLASLHRSSETLYGMSLLDLSTGEFLTAEGTPDYIDKLLSNFSPKELIVCRGSQQDTVRRFPLQCPVFEMDEWVFELGLARERLTRQFGTLSLKGFGIDSLDAAIIASGAVMLYLDQTQHTRTGHITSLRRIEENRYVSLDRFTVRNLELIQALGEGGRSLLEILDRTSTPMGARMLRRWLLFPLKDVDAITARHDAVEWFMRNRDNIDIANDLLGRVGDLERLISKVSTTRVTPREMVQLATALESIQPLKHLLADADALAGISDRLDPCQQLHDRITTLLRPDSPSLASKGNYINDGVDKELDNLRQIAYHGKEYLASLQARESERTSIPSLKIGFNNVFGYYIEVTNTHRDKVPAEWIRKQTLVNAERYITQELKAYEEKILTAEERITAIEASIYASLIQEAAEYITTLQNNATALAQCDVLASFARVSLEYHYNRPIVDNTLRLSICEGRHPVIERRMANDEQYISNSVALDNNATQVMMITGPNMSGKSALLRQTALNVIMAQIGCFVAADSAQIGIIDKIFTRVGASDNISLGESTFMVEMNEAAAILNNMSERSLILFDELGRGTSTYDGISIAWAIVEHIHSDSRRPKTLFATHYHELNDMESQFERVANFNVSVREIGGKVVFLRKLARGGSEHSFGIHVAKLAGMPPSIVKRADAVLHQLEQSHRDDATPKIAPAGEPGMQLSFFQLDDPVLSQIRDEIAELDINNLTPMAALNKLHDIKSIITGRS